MLRAARIGFLLQRRLRQGTIADTVANAGKAAAGSVHSHCNLAAPRMSSNAILQQCSRGLPVVTIDPFHICAYLDHADSLAAAACFGGGDVQRGTAGRGAEIGGIAGRLGGEGIDPPQPPPFRAWAAQPETDVALCALKMMTPGAGGS